MRYALALLLVPATATAAPKFVTGVSVTVDGKPATFEVRAKLDGCWRQATRAKANVTIERGKVKKVDIVENTEPRSTACLKRALLAAKAGTATASATITLTSIDADITLGKLESAGSVKSVGVAPADPNGLTANAINDTIKANAKDIRGCYQKALSSARPGLSGKVVVRFEIAPDGAVTTARLQSTTLDHKGVESCVVGQIKKLKFPLSSTKSTVTYPFLFQPG